jgi:O-antigen/teichoic acid export membrane protein
VIETVPQAKKIKNKMYSDSFIYVLSTMIQSGVQLLFIPYLTRVLTLSEYGEVELFLTLNGLFTIIIVYGVNTKIYEDAKEYNSFTLKSDCDNYKKEKYGVLFFNGCLIISGAILVNLLYEFELVYLIYAAITSAMFVFVVFELTIYQIRKQSLYYLFTNLIISFISVISTLLLISVFDKGAEGRYLGGLIAVSSLIMFFILKNKPKKFSLNLKSYTKNLKLLSPLAFTSIFSWLTESVDKLMINSMLTPEDLAIYSVGYKFGLIILILTSSVSRAWMPYVIDNEHNIKKIFNNMFIFSLIMIFSTIFYMIAMSYFYYKIVPVEYHIGIMIANVISVAYLFDGITKLTNAIFIVKGKVSIYIRITIFSGLLNVSLNAFLIPEFGYVGAAYATIISFFTSFLLALIISYNIMRREIHNQLF